MIYFLIEMFAKQYNILYLLYVIYFYLLYYYFYKINYISTYFIDYEYNLSKLIAFFSTMETISFFLIILCIITATLQYKYKKLNEWIIFIYLIILYNINTPMLNKNYYINTHFFNQLLNHTLGSIHPILIFISLFLIKWSFFIKKNKTFIFYLLTISIWLGMLWSSNLFGWGGLWNWDPIEQISFYYWVTILLFLHNNKNMYLIYIFIIYDLYFSFLFKINIIESIHMFHKELFNYIVNNYSFNILLIIFLYFFAIILLNNIKKKNTQHRTKNSYLYFYITIIFFFIYLHYQLNIQEYNLLYSFTFNTTLLIFTYTIYLISKNRLILLCLNPIFLINMFFLINKDIYLFFTKHIMYFLFIFLCYFYYIYTKEYNTFYLLNQNYYISNTTNNTFENTIINYISMIENKTIYNFFNNITKKNVETLYSTQLINEYSLKTIKNQLTTSNYTTVITLKYIYMYTIKLKTLIIISSYFLIIIIFLILLYSILQLCYKKQK